MKLDKSIPIPPLVVGQQRYPWHEMEIGDSFFIEGRTSTKMRPTIHAAQIRWDRKFCARNVDGGVRIWRTE